VKGLYIQIKTYALIGIFLSEQKKKQLHEHALFFLSFLFYYESLPLFYEKQVSCILVIVAGRSMTHPQLVSKRLSPTCREAMPKSAILMLFFSSSSRFSGFRSLWLQNMKSKMLKIYTSTH